MVRTLDSAVMMCEVKIEDNNNDNEGGYIRKLHVFNEGNLENTWYMKQGIDPQGVYLAGGDIEGNIRFWKLNAENIDETVESRIKTPNNRWARMVAFAPDGLSFVVGTDNGKILRYVKKSAATVKLEAEEDDEDEGEMDQE
jgi:WD40 repeat protein